jgi:hypothetical protein
MNRLRRRAVAAMMALALSRAFAQDAHVLMLRYRRAEDVIPMLRPYLDPAAKLTGQGDQLYLRTSLQNLAQIRQLLATLDRPPRWLAIVVRQERPPVAADADLPNRSMVVESRAATAPARADGSQIARTRPNEQRIRVLEGTRVPIQFEAAVPMTFRHFAIGNDSVQEVRGTVTYDALVAFVVRPQLAGTVVTLEIEPQEAAVLTPAGERGRLATTTHGRLGDWIAVGGADVRDANDPPEQRTGALHARTRPTTDQRGVWLKVELETEGTR